MAEIDDLMRAALGRAALAADAAVDLAAARRAVRGRIAAGEAGQHVEVAPGWRLIRWGFAAHRVAWTALITAVAVVATVLVIVGIRGEAPVAPSGPGTGMTTPPPVTEPGPGSAVTTDASDSETSSAAWLTGTASATTTTAPVTSSAGPPMTAPSSSTQPRSTTSAAPPRTTGSSAPRTSSVPPGGTATGAPLPTTAPVTTSPAVTAPPSTVLPTTVLPTTVLPTTRTTATSTTTPAADTEPPVILSFFATAQEVTPGQTVSIIAQVTDNVAVTGVRLVWSGKGESEPSGAAEMTPSRTGWVFTTTVPKLDAGARVVFTATARDAAGNRSEQAVIAVVVQL